MKAPQRPIPPRRATGEGEPRGGVRAKPATSDDRIVPGSWMKKRKKPPHLGSPIAIAAVEPDLDDPCAGAFAPPARAVVGPATGSTAAPAGSRLSSHEAVSAVRVRRRSDRGGRLVGWLSCVDRGLTDARAFLVRDAGRPRRGGDRPASTNALLLAVAAGRVATMPRSLSACWRLARHRLRLRFQFVPIPPGRSRPGQRSGHAPGRSAPMALAVHRQLVRDQIFDTAPLQSSGRRCATSINVWPDPGASGPSRPSRRSPTRSCRRCRLARPGGIGAPARSPSTSASTRRRSTQPGYVDVPRYGSFDAATVPVIGLIGPVAIELGHWPPACRATRRCPVLWSRPWRRNHRARARLSPGLAAALGDADSGPGHRDLAALLAAGAGLARRLPALDHRAGDRRYPSIAMDTCLLGLIDLVLAFGIATLGRIEHQAHACRPCRHPAGEGPHDAPAGRQQLRCHRHLRRQQPGAVVQSRGRAGSPGWPRIIGRPMRQCADRRARLVQDARSDGWRSRRPRPSTAPGSVSRSRRPSGAEVDEGRIGIAILRDVLSASSEASSSAWRCDAPSACRSRPCSTAGSSTRSSTPAAPAHGDPAARSGNSRFRAITARSTARLAISC